jgi:hypothetical protein
MTLNEPDSGDRLSECLATDVISAAAKKVGQVAALKLYVIPLHTPLQEIVGVLRT